MLGLFSPAVAQAVDVVVVKSRDLAAYDKAVAGFKETFKGSVSVVVMQGRLSDSANLASAVREAQPKAILAVGLRAANALRAEISDIPIVFCLAAHPSQNKLRAANVTGVDLEPTIKDQLRNFKEVAPRIKKLGVIYDAKRSARMVEEAKAAAVELGITLITRSVEERKDVPSALKEILNEADSLWLIRDVTVVTRELFNHTLLLQAEKKLPILVYSDQFVRKGAVCSFSASYPNQGKKAAQVVQAILDGANPGEMPVQTPEGTLFINVGSAAKADVIVPPAVLKRPGVVAIGQ
jgi:putative ABC transport system substrate-binding protein